MPKSAPKPFRTELRTRRDLILYVVRTTCLCGALALVCDVVNQLIFFESWSAASRSWGITVGIVVAITVPVSRAIGLANLALFHASRTDPLTGLLNRRALLEGFEDQPSVFALIIVDIDRFKQVNDVHGHLIGDEVLRCVSRVLSEKLAQIGRVGRLGGEEFAVLASKGDEDSLLTALEQFRDTISTTPLIAHETAVSVTISAGYARRIANQSFEDLYARADRALYMAKASGRNRIVAADDLDAQLGVKAVSGSAAGANGGRGNLRSAS